MKPSEKHALAEAASAFSTFGVEIHMPWEHDLDDGERVLYAALLSACRAYHDRMNYEDSP